MQQWLDNIEQIYSVKLSEKFRKAFYEVTKNITIPVTFKKEKGFTPQWMCVREGEAVVSLSDDTPDKLFEELLLHELAHVKQFCDGFPDLYTSISNDQRYEQCTSLVSSIILDQEIDSFLHRNKITTHKDIAGKQYQLYKKKIEQWASPKFAPHVEPVETLSFASIFVNLYLSYNKQKALYLVDVTSRFDTHIREYTNALLDIVQTGNYFTPIGCCQIFQRCMQTFPFMEWYIGVRSSN